MGHTERKKERKKEKQPPENLDVELTIVSLHQLLLAKKRGKEK